MKKRSLAAWFVLLLMGLALAPLTAIAIQIRHLLPWVIYSSTPLQLEHPPIQSLAVPLAPTLAVSQIATPNELAEPGGIITYSVQITNPDRRDRIQLTQLRDSVYSNITRPGHHGILSTTCRDPQRIDPLAEYTCAFVANITGNARDQQTNTLTVYADDGKNDVVAGEATTTVTFTDLPSSLTLRKETNASQIPASGTVVTYSLWITNTSLADQVRINRVADDRFGNVSNSCQRSLPTTLTVGEGLICVFSRLLRGQAGDKHTSVTTVTGLDDDGATVSAEGTATVQFVTAPEVALTATADPPVVPEAGGPVAYNLQIRNLSKTELTLQTLTDAWGQVSATCEPAWATPLPGGEAQRCRYVRTVQGDYDTEQVNSITVNGASADGQAVTVTTEVPVTFSDTPAALTVQDIPSRATIPGKNTLVTFTVQINNTSLVDSVTVEQITDSLFGNVAANNPALTATNCTTPQTLPSGGYYTCQFSAVLRGARGAVYNYVLTVKGSDDDGAKVQAQAQATVAVGSALLRATKRASLLQDLNGDNIASPGDTIGYTVLITNAGEVADTLAFTDRLDPNTVLLADQATSTQGTVLTSPVSLTVNLGLLAPAQVAAITFPVVVANPLPANISQISNQGLIVGEITPALLTDNPDTTAVDDPTVTPVVAQPRLLATKVVGLATDHNGDVLPSPGDLISYTIEIVNVGNQEAAAVVLADTLDAATVLATGSAVSNQGEIVSGTNSPTSLQVQLGNLAVGATALIRFAALVADPLPAGISQISNQALITGANIPPTVTDDPSTTAAADPTRLLLASAPFLHLTKRDLLFTDSDGDNAVSVGDTLLYTLRLANLGNSPAQNIVLSDTPDVHTSLVAGKVQASAGQILTGNVATDRSITLAIPELLPQQRVDLAFRVLVGAGGALLTNQASGRYSYSQKGTQVELTLLSDDPDTGPLNDPTVTPLKTSLSPSNNRAFLPLVRR